MSLNHITRLTDQLYQDTTVLLSGLLASFIAIKRIDPPLNLIPLEVLKTIAETYPELKPAIDDFLESSTLYAALNLNARLIDHLLTYLREKRQVSLSQDSNPT